MKGISIFLLVVALVVGIVLGAVGCGDGTDPYADYIRIYDWTDLDNVRNNMVDKCVLMNDLDSNTASYGELAGETANGGNGWEPIGNYTGANFTGVFDGQGHEIRDLFVNRPDEDNVGLFGAVANGGVIKDVGVTGANATGHESVGPLVGRNEGGTVSDCYSIATVAGWRGVGGLVGYNIHGGNVSNCYASAIVSASWQYVGGLVGANYYATVSNSHYNYDDVLINGENIITVGALSAEDYDEWLNNGMFLDVDERLPEDDGYYLIGDVNSFKELLAFGQDSALRFRLADDLDLSTEPGFYIPYLAGEFDGNGYRISNLNFNHDFISQVGLFGILAPGGEITGLGAENVNLLGARSIGGLVGANHGTVSDSYSTGILHNTRQVGGLIGGNGGIVIDCYSTTDVNGYELVGGLVGGNEGTVSDSYFSGNVTGHWYAGGLVGGNEGTVTNSYSTGSVTADSSVGGLVGHNYTNGIATNSFWDIETSGQATSAGGTGKTTAEMHDISTFTGASWDIVAVGSPDIRNVSYIWNIVDDETYPFLGWEPV